MIARNLLIALAIMAIFFNVMLYVTLETHIPQGSMVEKTGYLIERNIYFIVAFIFLVSAYFINRGIKRNRHKKVSGSVLK
jgi:hypothetical protein